MGPWPHESMAPCVFPSVDRFAEVLVWWLFGWLASIYYPGLLLPTATTPHCCAIANGQCCNYSCPRLRYFAARLLLNSLYWAAGFPVFVSFFYPCSSLRVSFSKP